MSTWAVLASGPSMTQEIADQCREACKVVAVSDSYRIAPWADAIVAQDKAWWLIHGAAVAKLSGRKFCGPRCEGIKGPVPVEPAGLVSSGTNSGLLACHVAVAILGATKLVLCGFDMHGTHFFGPHPAPLKNTPQFRFEIMRDQFKAFSPKGVEVVNATPGSSLTCYPMADLCDALG